MTVFAALLIGVHKSARDCGEQTVPSAVEILLVSGTHANEPCAPLMAREVLRVLREQRVPVDLYEIPYRYTLQAVIDDPAIAATEYSRPAGGRRLDVDLDALDERLRRRYPRALVFEFHNSEDTQPMLGIDLGKPVAEFEVGPIGPWSGRTHEIGTWRNVDRDGRPDKHLIEVPASYVLEGLPVRQRRRERLARLREEGDEYDPRWEHYFESRADIEASRDKGYLDECLARKIADWILGCCRESR
jgi:hypothetical protein